MTGLRAFVVGVAGILFASAAAAADMTNKDVIDLVKAGVGAEVVVAKVESGTCAFDTSALGLKSLKRAKVPDEVVMAMVRCAADEPQSKPRKKDELVERFPKLKNAVVTVWSETGHGTGFIVDKKGLIVTNHHVVGPSPYLAVQFDEKRKVRAVLLGAEPERDLAVLWADLSAFPEALAAPIARSKDGKPLVEVGERVFTIGSPLNQRKIVTTGMVARIGNGAILSDIVVNSGNSGGPLFNDDGQVVGVTTFGERGPVGPGVAGTVRIELAAELLAAAKQQMADLKDRPSATLLPVEPIEPFPIDAIRAATPDGGDFDKKPYVFDAGAYKVAVITPIFAYHSDERTRAALKSKEKRTKSKDDGLDPLMNLYTWQEYVGGFEAVIMIRATPKLKETFWSKMERGLNAVAGAYYMSEANLKFKADFYRMELMCGDTVVEPIHPGRIAHVIDFNNGYVNANDATYEGLYTYAPDAISASCGKVSLRIYSEKDPEKAKTKDLDKKTVVRVASDFEPWKAAAPAAR